jgi:hypothetical protein
MVAAVHMVAQLATSALAAFMMYRLWEFFYKQCDASVCFSIYVNLTRCDAFATILRRAFFENTKYKFRSITNLFIYYILYQAVLEEVSIFNLLTLPYHHHDGRHE